MGGGAPCARARQEGGVLPQREPWVGVPEPACEGDGRFPGLQLLGGAEVAQSRASKPCSRDGSHPRDPPRAPSCNGAITPTSARAGVQTRELKKFRLIALRSRPVTRRLYALGRRCLASRGVSGGRGSSQGSATGTGAKSCMCRSTARATLLGRGTSRTLRPLRTLESAKVWWSGREGGLVVGRTAVAEAAVPPLQVVPAFDPLEYRGAGGGPAGPGRASPSSFFKVEKKDSASALSRHCPVGTSPGLWGSGGLPHVGGGGQHLDLLCTTEVELPEKCLRRWQEQGP